MVDILDRVLTINHGIALELPNILETFQRQDALNDRVEDNGSIFASLVASVALYGNRNVILVNIDDADVGLQHITVRQGDLGVDFVGSGNQTTDLDGFTVRVRNLIVVQIPRITTHNPIGTVKRRIDGLEGHRVVQSHVHRIFRIAGGGYDKPIFRHIAARQKRLRGRWCYPTEQLVFRIVWMRCFAACLACSQVEERH